MIGALTAAAALVLVVSGVAKLRAPAPTARMITSLVPRWRRPVALVVVIGTGEIGVGSSVLALGGRVAAALLAGCYLAFTVVAVRLMTRPARVSCGCFGRADAPVGIAHVILDVVCCAAAAAAAVLPVPAFGGALHHAPAIAVIGIAQVLLLAWLAYLAVTALPALAAAARDVA